MTLSNHFTTQCNLIGFVMSPVPPAPTSSSATRLDTGPSVDRAGWRPNRDDGWRGAALNRRSFFAYGGAAALAMGAPVHLLGTTLPVQPALMSDTVVDSWGMNTHLNWQHSVWGDEVAVTDLLLALGVRHIRALISPRMAAQRYAFQRLAGNGCQVEALMGDRVDGATLTKARAVVNSRLDEIVNFYGGSASGIFSALEGCNEPNNDGVPQATWVAQTRNLSQAIWEESKKRSGTSSIPVAGPGLARQVGVGVPTPEHDFMAVGNLSPWTDYANIHVYPRGNRPSDEIDRFMAAARQAYPSGQNFHTSEGGYFNAMAYTATISPPTPEDVTAVYAPRHVLEHVLRGNHRFFSYELLDDLDSNNSLRDNNFGYVRTPSLDSTTWSLKPVFFAMQNFVALFSDRGSSFTPTGLPMSISGGGSDLRSILVQKRSGTHLLCLWRDVDVYKWDRVNRTGSALPIDPAPMIVTLQTPADVAVFQPTDSPDAVQTYSSTTSVAVPLTGQLVVLEIS
jgi:hypothetical protein